MSLSKSALFRKRSGSNELDVTAKKVTQVLTAGGIPCTIIGGYALQEHGYRRYTEDIDIVVPDIQEAQSYLAIRGFKPTGAKSILYDRDNGVEINMLPGGGEATKNSPLKVPLVNHPPTNEPFIVPMRELVEMKLNVYVGSPDLYIKHKSDVQELIRLNHLQKEWFHTSNKQIQDAWDHSWEVEKQRREE